MTGLTPYHSHPDPERPSPAFRQVIISLIVLIYFEIAALQQLPEGPLYERAYTTLSPIISLFGLKQRYNLFAPDMSKVNVYSTCLVTMQDGTERLYEFPRNEKLTLMEKFQRQRLCHYVNQCWEQIRYRHLRPFNARYIARCNSNPDNPPACIRLIYNSRDIPDFKHYTKQADLPETGFTKQLTFGYPVQPGDLK